MVNVTSVLHRENLASPLNNAREEASARNRLVPVRLAPNKWVDSVRRKSSVCQVKFFMLVCAGTKLGWEKAV